MDQNFDILQYLAQRLGSNGDPEGTAQSAIGQAIAPALGAHFDSIANDWAARQPRETGSFADQVRDPQGLQQAMNVAMSIGPMGLGKIGQGLLGRFFNRHAQDNLGFSNSIRGRLGEDFASPEGFASPDALPQFDGPPTIPGQHWTPAALAQYRAAEGPQIPAGTGPIIEHDPMPAQAFTDAHLQRGNENALAGITPGPIGPMGIPYGEQPALPAGAEDRLKATMDLLRRMEWWLSR